MKRITSIKLQIGWCTHRDTDIQYIVLGQQRWRCFLAFRRFLIKRIGKRITTRWRAHANCVSLVCERDDAAAASRTQATQERKKKKSRYRSIVFVFFFFWEGCDRPTDHLLQPPIFNPSPQQHFLSIHHIHCLTYQTHPKQFHTHNTQFLNFWFFHFSPRFTNNNEKAKSKSKESIHGKYLSLPPPLSSLTSWWEEWGKGLCWRNIRAGAGERLSLFFSLICTDG
jgi:hypothetical protein